MIKNQSIIYMKQTNLNCIVQGLYVVRGTTDVYCKNNKKNENAFCEQNLELLNTKQYLFVITTVL
jgi:hypothetical protein